MKTALKVTGIAVGAYAVANTLYWAFVGSGWYIVYAVHEMSKKEAKSVKDNFKVACDVIGEMTDVAKTGWKALVKGFVRH